LVVGSTVVVVVVAGSVVVTIVEVVAVGLNVVVDGVVLDVDAKIPLVVVDSVLVVDEIVWGSNVAVVGVVIIVVVGVVVISTFNMGGIGVFEAVEVSFARVV